MFNATTMTFFVFFKLFDRSSRLSRQLGRNQMGQLMPIDDLGSLSCCSDSCSRLALTHSTLLEEWRMQAAQGQRQARRVLAEMLTPSGGTKANCYKFISMVTGNNLGLLRRASYFFCQCRTFRFFHFIHTFVFSI